MVWRLITVFRYVCLALNTVTLYSQTAKQSYTAPLYVNIVFETLSTAWAQQEKSQASKASFCHFFFPRQHHTAGLHSVRFYGAAFLAGALEVSTRTVGF